MFTGTCCATVLALKILIWHCGTFWPLHKFGLKYLMLIFGFVFDFFQQESRIDVT